jgi:thiamine-monophosphate kinase
LRIAQIGEFELINRISRIVDDRSDQIVLGIGDDAAVVCAHPGWETIITTDTLIEGVHFDLSYTPIDKLGWKALAINISDIASMGGIPRYAVVSLAISKDWKIKDVEDFYEGLARCCHQTNCSIVGGDTVKSEKNFIITVTILGEVEEGCAVRRSGAKEGDVLCVTGELGGAKVGLEVLKNNKSINRFPDSVNRFFEPRLRFKEARKLVKELEVSSMIDISDGLASEVTHLCRESKLGCLLWKEKIPLNMEVKRWANECCQTAEQYALAGGEEYELLFTVDRKRFEIWQEEDSNIKDLKVTMIGEMINRKDGINIMDGKRRLKLSYKGWDHFKT